MAKKQNISDPPLLERIEDVVQPKVTEPTEEPQTAPDLYYKQPPSLELDQSQLPENYFQEPQFAQSAQSADASSWEKILNDIENTWGQLKAARWNIAQSLNIPLSYGDKGITWLADKAGLDDETTDWLRKKWADNTAITPGELGALDRIFPSGTQQGMNALESIFLDEDQRKERFAPRTFPEEQGRIAERAQRAAGEMKPGGSIINGIMNGDPGEIAAGVVGGTLGYVPSLVVGLSTAGAGFVPWVTGMELNHSVQTESALSDQGMAELFEQGDANVGTSLLVGVSTGLLEKYGFSRLSKYLGGKEIGRTFAERFRTLMSETGRQGFINWVEAGLSHYADKYSQLDAKAEDDSLETKAKNQWKAAKEAGDWMFSLEGADAALKAMAGTMVMGAGKNIGRSFAPKNNAAVKRVEVAPGRKSVMIESKDGTMVLVERMDKKAADDTRKFLEETYPNSEFETVAVVDKKGDFVEGKFTVEQKPAQAEKTETTEAKTEEKLSETEKKSEKTEEKVPETETETTDKEQTKRDDGEQKLPKKETSTEDESTKNVAEETKDARKTEEKTEESVPEEGTEGRTTKQGRVRDDGKDRKTQTETDVNKLVEELPDDNRGKITAKGIKKKLDQGRKRIDKKIKEAKKKLAEEFVGGTKKIQKVKPGLENIKKQLYKVAPRKAVDEIVNEVYEQDVKGIDESGYIITDKRDGKDVLYKVKFLPNGKTIVTEQTAKGDKNLNVPKGALHNKLVDRATAQRSAVFQRMYEKQVQALENELYDQLYDQIADYRTGRHKDIPTPAPKGRFPDQPRKKTRTSKEPTKKERMPSFGTKVVVDQMASYKKQIVEEIKNRKLGAKRANEIKSDFIDLLKGLLKDSDVKQLHGRQIGALIGKIRKVKEENALAVIDEVIEYVEKMGESKEKKEAQDTLKELLNTKTQTIDKASKKKKGWQGTQRKLYYLEAANNYYKKFQSYKSGVQKLIKKPPKGANEQQKKNIQAANESMMLKEHHEMVKWFETQLADINKRLMDDDIVVREKAMAEQAAFETMALLWAVNRTSAKAGKGLVMVESIWDNTTDDLNLINKEIARILAGEKSKLASKIEAETRRRNVFKQMARKQTEGRYAGMDQQQIQQARKGKGVNQFTQFFKDMRISARSWFNKNINSPITASLDFTIKKIEARQSLVGRGSLYEHLMKGPRGWIAAKRDWYDRRKEFKQKLEDGEKRIFGKKLSNFEKFKLGKEVAETGIYTVLPNGERSTVPQVMAIAQAMYTYALSQMPAVRSKLEAQGWDSVALEQLEKFLGDKYIQYVELYTKELFPERFKEYNRRYIEQFSTPLDKIENFMPLTYDQVGALLGEGDLTIGETKFMMPSTMPKHIKYRTENTHKLNVMGNFFAIANSYTLAMERWYNYSNFVSDANILLSDAEVMRNMENQNPGISKLLREAVTRSAGVYKEVDGIQAAMHEVNRGVALAMIGFKLWTAAKQIISVLAWAEKSYRPEIKIADRTLYIPMVGSLKFITKMVINAPTFYKNHRFFMKHSSFYRERYEKGAIGDEQIVRMLLNTAKPTKTAFGFRRKQLEKGIIKTALAPNKFVDALAINIGGKVFYDEQFNNYRKSGMSSSEAHRLAINDFDLEFNLAQQSSEEAFLGPLQSDVGLGKAMLATFKNSQMAYYRKNAEALIDGSNEYRRKRDSEYKRLIGQGMSEEKARRRSRFKGLKAVKSKAFGDAIKKAVIYGTALPLAWQYFQSGLPGIYTDKTDEDEDEMIRSILFGMIDGLVVFSDLGKYAYDVAYLDKAYAPKIGLLAIDEFVSIYQDMHKAYDESGEINMSVMKELGRLIVLYRLKVDWDNIPVIYEGLKKLILNGDLSKENVGKLMKAPDKMIEEIEKGKDPYAARRARIEEAKKKKAKKEKKGKDPYADRKKRLNKNN